MLEDYSKFFAAIKKAGDGERRLYILSSSGAIILEQKHSSVRDKQAMSNFYSDITKIILDKLEPKNWK